MYVYNQIIWNHSVFMRNKFSWGKVATRGEANGFTIRRQNLGNFKKLDEEKSWKNYYRT